ncbi:hypothetical protein Tco_0682538 [Tanacetum coccineum]|uniref:Uncharacterized protein n=1 Tax=Tanacetum coccineum TaxID=301880 RepID=A0ABQ4XSV0_9ASTR
MVSGDQPVCGSRDSGSSSRSVGQRSADTQSLSNDLQIRSHFPLFLRTCASIIESGLMRTGSAITGPIGKEAC